MEADPIILTVESPGKLTERVDVFPDEAVTFGRAFGNSVVLSGTGVSRRHARIFHRQGSYWIEDLSSRNGTGLNGKQLETPGRLTDGDCVEISQYRINVAAEPETGPVHYADRGEPAIIHSTDVNLVLDQKYDSTTEQALEPGVESVNILLKKLETVGLALLAHLPLEELFDEILRQVEDILGSERSALLLREDGDEELVLKAVRGAKGEFREIPISRSIARRVLEERHALLIEDAQQDARFQAMESVALHGVRTVLCVPLWDDREVIGLLYADKVHRNVPFRESELHLLTLIGHLAAVKIRAAQEEIAHQMRREIEKELIDAARIQQQLLPEEIHEGEGFRIFGRNIPCLEVGGDYFDFIDNPDGSLTLAFGDVAGKGMAAALLMSSLHSRVQAYNESGLSLPEIAKRLNDSLHEQMQGMKSVTFFLARYHPARGELEYVNAGHNPPLLRDKKGNLTRLFTGDLLLGALPEAEYASRRQKLSAGDLLVIYSDGVTEAQTSEGEEFGAERLEAFLASRCDSEPCELVGALVDEVHRFCAPEPLFDDLSLVILTRL